jgi:hypothetical protein
VPDPDIFAVDTPEVGAHELHLRDSVLLVVAALSARTNIIEHALDSHIHAITDVVRVFHKQEDA